MDIWGVLQAILRRWYVFLAVALLIVPVFLVVDREDFAEYTSHGPITLVHSGGAETDGTRPNQYSSSLAGELVRLQLTSTQTRALIKGQGLSSDYSVDRNIREPDLLMISASAPTPQLAMDTVTGLHEQAAIILDTEQAARDVPKTSRTVSDVVFGPSPPEQTGGASRIFLGVLAALLVLGAVAAVVADRLLSNRPSGDDGTKSVEDPFMNGDASAPAGLNGAPKDIDSSPSEITDSAGEVGGYRSKRSKNQFALPSGT